MAEPSRDGRLPDFLIGGEAKCGSTTLWQILSQHPRVFFPEQKELHYFASYSDFPEIGRLEANGLAPYTALFAAAGREQRCGEATPNYLFDEGACARIARTLPAVRMVFILRDPVERAWSHYWHQVRRGREPLSFEDALREEAERLAGDDVDRRTYFSYVARGRFVEGLRRYERALSREQICVVFLEELRRQRAQVIAGVCAHLSLAAEPLAQASVPHANQGNFPRWPQLAALGKTVQRWASTQSPAVERWTRAFGRATRPLRVYQGAPRMNPETRLRLREEFRESDRELAAWLGRDAPWCEAGSETRSAWSR